MKGLLPPKVRTLYRFYRVNNFRVYSKLEIKAPEQNFSQVFYVTQGVNF